MAKYYTWVALKPCISTGWEFTGWKYLLSKGAGGLHVHEIEHGPAMSPVGKEGQQHSWLPENEY